MDKDENEWFVKVSLHIDHILHPVKLHILFVIRLL